MPKVSNRQQCLKWVRSQLYSSILCESSSEDEAFMSTSSDGSANSSDESAFNSTASDSIMDLDSSSDSEAGVTDPTDTRAKPGEWLELNFVIESQRFLADRTKRVQSKQFADDFFRHVLPPDLFRQMCRMDKEAFFHLLTLIEMHPVFSNNSLHDQAPVSLQLPTCLDRLGHNGNGVCLRRTLLLWGLSVGSCVNYTTRVVTALESALADYVAWPNIEERIAISAEFAKTGFPGCVGLIDGTLLPLSQRPAIDGECYFDRKSWYSINAQVVCDHRRKITFVYSGMPGSCQDITCLKRSQLWAEIHSNSNFDEGQYILGDSGYVNAPHMVASYKNTYQQRDKEQFNTCVAKTRYVNEHCIGVLKSRWFSLKEIRTQLNKKKDNVWMCRWIRVCTLLHNFVLFMKDDWRQEDMECPLEVTDFDEAGSGDSQNMREETGATIARNEASRVAGRALQRRVMQHTLEFNSGPGGFLNDE